MKKTIVLLTAITMTLSSFTTTDKRNPSMRGAALHLAIKTIDALKHKSASDYKALFPSLADFHALMDKNAALYGENLLEAKADFADQYKHELVPALKSSYEKIIAAGKERGINWESIKYLGATVEESASGETATVLITFEADGKEFSVRIEKAILLNGGWKLSQFASLR